MTNTYYLPINATSLAHYFGSACIKQAKYFNNKKEDLQDKFKDFLLLTTNFGTQETDCCLEIVLTEKEVKDFLIDAKNGFFLFENPLPITRVKKIYFCNEELKDQTITNINMSTGFIQDNLTAIVKTFDNPQINEIQIPQDAKGLDFAEQLLSYDRFLGAFILMRLAGEEYMNYSENYFATLAFFNSKIQKELEQSKVKIKTLYRGLFSKNEQFNKIIPYLNQEIDEPLLNKIAKIEQQEIKKDNITKIINLESLSKLTYTVAVLNTFGVGKETKKKKIDELIFSNFRSGVKEEKAEGIALCYGYNRGYSVFSNKYRVNSNEKIVKFELNSQLDYYTIESIYQYIFSGKKISNEFEYLNWCPKQECSDIIRRNHYKILDTLVIGKKKTSVLSKEYWEDLLASFGQNNDIYEKFLDLAEVIKNDIRNEFSEEVEEINIIKQENKIPKEKLSAAETKKNQIQENNSVLSGSIKEIKAISPAISDRRTNHDYVSDMTIVIQKTLNYEKKNLTELKNEAKERGINLEGKMKKDDIIIKLITTKDEVNG